MNNKRKGKRGELEAARLLRGYGYDARRGVQYKGGADSPDVIGLPGVHLEVKFTQKTALYDWIAQAQHDAGPGEIAAVMHRKTYSPWLFILTADDFIRLYKIYDLYHDKEDGENDEKGNKQNEDAER